MAPLAIKNLKGLQDFRNKIRRWNGCDCKLCKDFVKAGCEIGTGLAMVATE